MKARRIGSTSAVLLAAALAVLAGCGGSVAGVASPGSAAITNASPVESALDLTDPAESSAAQTDPAQTDSAGPASSDGAQTSEPATEQSPAPDGADTSATASSGTAGVVRYLAIGDSLTQGIGASDLDKGTFPALLAQRWRDAGCEVELKNVGISGYTAAQIVADQVPEIVPFQPTVVTFQGGGNDIANGVTIDDYRKNVNVVLDATKAVGARVLVFAQNEWYRSPVGQNYGGMALADQRAAYDQVLIDAAAAHGAQFVDLRPLYKEEADKNQWFEDGLHPTPQAYADWSVAMAAAVPAPCR